jgi:hypothetical protein
MYAWIHVCAPHGIYSSSEGPGSGLTVWLKHFYLVEALVGKYISVIFIILKYTQFYISHKQQHCNV